jgi:hypothetical protein
VQYTGPSAYLPQADGLFRFQTADDAARAFEAVARDYEHHSQAARSLAERLFDAPAVAARLLEHALT